jgi:hypothetical protein
MRALREALSPYPYDVAQLRGLAVASNDLRAALLGDDMPPKVYLRDAGLGWSIADAYVCEGTAVSSPRAQWRAWR